MFQQPDDIVSVTVDGYDQFDLDKMQEGDFEILHQNGQGQFMVRYLGKQFSATIIDRDFQNGNYLIRINGADFKCTVQSRLWQLIQDLGFNKISKKHNTEIHAPMPGLVLSCAVKAGDVIKTGDTLLTLEAMKMENILKAEFDGKVEQVLVNPGDKVDKGQLIIKFAEKAPASA